MNSELEITVKEAFENAKDAGYEEGCKKTRNDIRYFLNTYKSDTGLRNRLEMYLADCEND